MATGDEDLGSYGRQFSKSYFGKPDQAITENRDFLEQKRLEDALRAAKPSALKDGSQGLFGNPPNAVARTEDQSRRTDFGVGSIQRQPRQPFFPEESAATTTQVSGTQVTPFFVSTAAGTVPGTTVLKVYPGKIASIVPTMDGVKLDNSPTPSLLVTAIAPFSLFLRANITVDTDNLFRSSITAVKVCTDNDADVIPDIDPGTGEVPERKIFWDNPALTVGHFYLLIADINVNNLSQVIGLPRQWLFSSYSTFVATADETVTVV